MSAVFRAADREKTVWDAARLHRIKNGKGAVWKRIGAAGGKRTRGSMGARRGKRNEGAEEEGEKHYQVRTPWETAGRKATGPQRDACDAPAASCQVRLSHSANPSKGGARKAEERETALEGG